jgi:hypothetical protein
METYTEYKPFVENPNFAEDRRDMVENLEAGGMDPHLVPLVEKINRLPSVFSLQCCHGHFLSQEGKEMFPILEASSGTQNRTHGYFPIR